MSPVSQIPGLDDVDFLALLNTKDFLAPFDIGFAGSQWDNVCKAGSDCKEKGPLGNSASGTWESRYVNCNGPDCAHIEVRREGGISKQNNIRWFTTKQEWLKAGNIPVPLCDKEPTGRYPFGLRQLKVAVTKINEPLGEVEFGLYLSVKGPFGIQSANCIGPFPLPFWGKRKEGERILFGSDQPGAVPALSDVTPGEAYHQSISQSQTAVLPTPVDCEGSESNFINPAPGGTITSTYGWRTHPVTGHRRFHSGVDLSRGFGHPVLASNCGVVTHASPLGGYGYTVIIMHSNRMETLYAHNTKLLVKVGDQIKRGQLIAEEGSTGLSTGPHVHFETLYPHPEDPCLVLPIC